MSDVRQGLPSASSFEIDALCPGRGQLIQSIPPEELEREKNQPRDEDDVATRGTRIHKAREMMDGSDLDEEDREIYKRGLETEARIVAGWQEQFGIKEYIEGPREQRLWLHWPDSMDRATSGQLDVQYISRDPVGYLLVIDWKALWAVWVTAAERNYQARVQAVCGANEHDAKHVRVAFNKAMLGRFDQVDYGFEDLNRAHVSIFNALWERLQPGAQRRAGAWCNYCPGKAWCAEAGAFSMMPMNKSIAPLSPSLDKDSVEALVKIMQPEDLAFLHVRASLVAKILAAVKARLKTFSDEELNALGLMRGKEKKLDYIRDTRKAFEYFKAFGISEDELWSALSFAKGELVDAIRRDQGWGKDATAGFVDGNETSQFYERKKSEPPIISNA